MAASDLEALAAAATAIVMLIALLAALELFDRAHSGRGSQRSTPPVRRDR
jgi:hypothetical protein